MKKDTANTKATGQCSCGFPTYAATGKLDYVQRKIRIVRLKQGNEVRSLLGEEWVGIHSEDLCLIANSLEHYDPIFQYSAQFFLDSKRKTRSLWPLWHILPKYMKVVSGEIRAKGIFNKWAFKSTKQNIQK